MSTLDQLHDKILSARKGSQAYNNAIEKLRNFKGGMFRYYFYFCPSKSGRVTLSYFNERWNIDLSADFDSWERYLPECYRSFKDHLFSVSTGDGALLLVLMGVLTHPKATPDKVPVAMERVEKRYTSISTYDGKPFSKKIVSCHNAAEQLNVQSFLDFLYTTYYLGDLSLVNQDNSLNGWNLVSWEGDISI